MQCMRVTCRALQGGCELSDGPRGAPRSLMQPIGSASCCFQSFFSLPPSSLLTTSTFSVSRKVVLVVDFGARARSKCGLSFAVVAVVPLGGFYLCCLF